MKLKYILARCLSVFLLSLCLSCGGGGGAGNDGANARNVSGSWSGAIIKVADSCNNGAPSTILFTHEVTQNEDAVQLNSENLSFLGNTLGNEGFSVDATQAITVKQKVCSDSVRIEYDKISNDQDQTAGANQRIARSCAGRTDCEISYTGTAGRERAGAVGIASPEPPTSLLSGSSCESINQNPAEGQYLGDGGCGISDTSFQVQQQAADGAVILEPFAANGATSFLIDPAAHSMAISQTTELTIIDQAGITCDIICFPPSNFTVNCFKDGEIICTEQF